MTLKSKATNIAKSFDMFSTTELFKFNQSSKHSTITGGICSICLFLVVTLSFTTDIRNTLAGTTISYTTNIDKQSDPEQTTLKFGRDKFSFYFNLVDMQQNIIDMNSGQRYFNFILQQIKYTNRNASVPSFIPLQACRKQHFEQFPQLDFSKNSNLAKFRCPKLGTEIQLRGLMNNYVNLSVVNFVVTPCTPIPGDLPCASPLKVQQLFTNYSNLQLNFIPIRTEFNLDQVNYKSISLQQRMVAGISQQLSTTMVTYISQSDLLTDQSFMPYSDIQSDTIYKFENEFNSYTGARVSQTDYYARIIMFKAQNRYTYTRTVQKLSTILSYIGGFYGAISAMLFFLNLYTEQSYAIEQIKKFFILDNKNIKNYTKRYNILVFLGEKIYEIYKIFNFSMKWQIYQEIDAYRKEVQQQIDVSVLVKRIINLQMMISNFKQKIGGGFNCPDFTLNQVQKVMLKMENELDKSSIVNQTKKGTQKNRVSNVRLLSSNGYKIKVENIQGNIQLTQVQLNRKIPLQNQINEMNLEQEFIQKQAENSNFSKNISLKQNTINSPLK